MPIQCTSVMPDILMTHKGVRVYFTYRDNDIEQPASDYLFTTSATDGNEGRFDVRSLDVPCKEQLDMHPPYLRVGKDSCKKPQKQA